MGMADEFIPRTMKAGAMPITVAVTLSSVTLRSSGWGTAMDPSEARWIASALNQAADYVEGES